MEKKLMLIINPAAGRSAYKNDLGEALRVLDNGGYRTSIYFTNAAREATEFVIAYAQDYDTIACVGGDGTLSEVISGLMQVKDPPPLGYFPMGTANDVATTLALPKNDNIAAARRIVHGRPHPFDVGGFGDIGYFAYIAAFGAFTNVSYATPQNQKRVLGHLAYVLQGAAELPKLKGIHAVVIHDNGIEEGDYIYGSFSNSTSVAGIVHLKDELVSLGDGYSELVLVKDPVDLQKMKSIVDGVMLQKYDEENVRIIHTKKARFIFDAPVPWTRDGEDGGSWKDIELCNHHRPIQLIF